MYKQPKKISYRNMARVFFSILFISFFNTTSAQNKLKGEWIGEDLEYLAITDTTFLWESIMFFIDKYKYDVGKGQIILKSFYTTANQNVAIKEQDTAKCYINYKLLNEDSLILTIERKVGLEFSNSKREYNFKRKSSLKPDNILFQSVFFSSTACAGGCPQMKISIDYLGHIKFRGEQFTSPFEGNYKGKLTDEQLDLLKSILNKSKLDRFPERTPMMTDAPRYKFIFRYNNKEKRSYGVRVRYFHRELLKFLLTIYKEVEWNELDYEILFNEQ